MATISNVDSPFNESSGFGVTSPPSDGLPGGFAAAMIDCSIKNMASADVFEAISIPAGAVVLDVGVIVITGEGAGDTIDLGDGDDADGYFDGKSVETTGMSYSLNMNLNNTGSYVQNATAFAGGKHYTSADTIDVTAKAALAVAKFVVWCKYIQTNLN